MAVTTYGSVIDVATPNTSTSANVDPEVETADADSPLVDDLFDADQTYYLKNGNGSSTRSRWNAQRIWNLVFPLVCAGLIMGGAAIFLLRDFQNLYPGSGYVDSTKSIPTSSVASHKRGDDTGNESKKNQESSSTSSKGHHTSSLSSSSSSSSSSREFVPPNVDAGASCSVHPDCSLLIGNCCPTLEGKTLECCSR